MAPDRQTGVTGTGMIETGMNGTGMTGTGTADSAVPLLQVDDLVVHYHIRGAGTVVRSHETVHTVDGVSFTLEDRQTLGLVGESGCGKSTTGRNVLLLERPTSGHIHFRGQDLAAMPPRQLTELRRNMQIVFQDPIGALNPRHTVGQLIGEPLRVHDLVPKKQRRQRVGELLELVGLPGDAVSRFPHEFSGGQCQRIAIARSLAVEPNLLVLDEPVSALDVSIQAQILQLLTDLQSQFGLSYLFIAHDLAVVGEMSDRVAVMYLGKIVELADRDSLYARPHHPYTQALFSAVPIPDPTLSKLHHRAVVTGEVPSSLSPPAGCRFHTRCPMAQEVCRVEEPKLENVGDGHQVACHFAKEAVETNPFGSAVSSFVVEQLMTLRHPEPSINMAKTPAPALAGAVSADDKSATAAAHLLKRTEAQTDGVN
jgi:oligopeptide/dipeptide ABC transporter ATP-binding protein